MVLLMRLNNLSHVSTSYGSGKTPEEFSGKHFHRSDAGGAVGNWWRTIFFRRNGKSPGATLCRHGKTVFPAGWFGAPDERRC